MVRRDAVGLIEVRVVAPDVEDDRGLPVVVAGAVALRDELVELHVVVEDENRHLQAPAQLQDHLAGDAHLAPAGVAVGGVLEARAQRPGLIVEPDAEHPAGAAVAPERLRKELEEVPEALVHRRGRVRGEGLREGAQVAEGRRSREIVSAHVKPPQLLVVPRHPAPEDVALHALPLPGGQVGGEGRAVPLALLGLRALGARPALVVARVHLMLDLVEERLDVLVLGPDALGVVAVLAADLAAAAHAVEQLLLHALAAEVLRGLRDEVELPEHLPGQLGEAPQRPVQDGLDEGRLAAAEDLGLGGHEEVVQVLQRGLVERVVGVGLVEALEEDAPVAVPRLGPEVPDDGVADEALLAVVAVDVPDDAEVRGHRDVPDGVAGHGHREARAVLLVRVGVDAAVPADEVRRHGHLHDVAHAAVAPLAAEARELVPACAAVGRGVPAARDAPVAEAVLHVLRAVDEAARRAVLEEREALVRRGGALAVRDALPVVLARRRERAVGADEADVAAADGEPQGVGCGGRDRHVAVDRPVDEGACARRKRGHGLGEREWGNSFSLGVRNFFWGAKLLVGAARSGGGW